MLVFKSYVHSGNKRYKKGDKVPETFTEKQRKHLRSVGAIADVEPAKKQAGRGKPVVNKQEEKPAAQPVVEKAPVQTRAIKSIRDIQGLVEEDFKVLENAGYDTVDKLAAVAYKDLMPLPRIGKAKAKLIIDALKK